MVARHTAVAVAVFVAITPGVLLDPIYFAHDLMSEMYHYRHGHYYAGSNIYSHSRYLIRLWEYFTLAMLSSQPVIAATTATVAILGLVWSWYRSRPIAATNGFLMIFYSVLFSMQTVFIVRNFLILLPVFAYLAGVGFHALTDRISKLAVGWPRRVAILATAAGVTLVLGWNAWKQVAFGHSITDAQSQPLVRQVTEYVAQHASVQIALSPCLAGALATTDTPFPANVTVPNRAAKYIFRASEIESSKWGYRPPVLPGTRHNTLDWIGPREVNLNYYGDWAGADHAIILNIDAAENLGIVDALSRTRVCAFKTNVITGSSEMVPVRAWSMSN